MDNNKTKEKVKQLLKEYPWITSEIRELNKKLSEIARLKSIHPDTLKAATISEVPPSVTNAISDPIFQLVTRYDSEIEIYTRKINELLDKKKLIEHMLFQLDPIERRIIELRYIQNPSYRCDIWEWIAKHVNYSRIRVIEIYNRSLDKMVIWYKT